MSTALSTASVPLPSHISPGFIARLAREVVMELRELPDILSVFGLTLLQFERIKAMPYFQRVQEDFAAEWERLSSTQDRLKLISAVMLEEGLPRVGSHMIDKEVSPAVAIESGKFLAKLAGIGEGAKGETSGPSERFSIVINLGEDSKLQFTKDVTPAPLHAGVHEGVSAETRGNSEPPTLGEQPATQSAAEDLRETIRPIPEGKSET